MFSFVVSSTIKVRIPVCLKWFVIGEESQNQNS